MHYIQSGSSLKPVGDLRQVVNSLKADVYEVQVYPMQGPVLEVVSNLDMSVPEHIYGGIEDRVEKSFRAFDRRPLNTGILLSGERGMGKTLFIRIAINIALQRGVPVIVLKKVDSDTLSEIIGLINSISQPLLIVMDEFEKNFNIGNDRGDGDTQMPFLSMLDGLGSNQKRMFIASINTVAKLNDFMLNRPGRFYYHFNYAKLSEDDMRNYLKNETHGVDENIIEYAISILQSYAINYDGLAAIAAELNAGCSIDETLSDLNIDREGETSLTFRLSVNGYDYTGYGYDSIENIRRKSRYCISFHHDKFIAPGDKRPKLSPTGFVGDSFDVCLEPVCVTVDKNGTITLDTERLNYISLDEDIKIAKKRYEYLYMKDIKSISKISVKSTKASRRPLYLDV